MQFRRIISEIIDEQFKLYKQKHRYQTENSLCLRGARNTQESVSQVRWLKNSYVENILLEIRKYATKLKVFHIQ